MSLRDKLLKAGVGHETIVIEFPDGDEKVEVRERTVAQQFDLLEKARKPNGDLDQKLLGVETIMACVYDPDTGKPVFDAADKDFLLNEVSAAKFNLLLQAANKAAGLDAAEEVEADLKEISPDATSTS